MRILIATGIFPPDIGGPAQYAKELADEFLRQGNEVTPLAYKLEKKIPTGLRHLFYFFRLFFNIKNIDLIIALDSFSVGLPAVLAAKIFRKKIIIRLGGDFLWESYVERSGNLITLKNFYETMPVLSKKEKTIFSLTKFVLKNCSAVVFSTRWQADVFKTAYDFGEKNIFIIENFYGEKSGDFDFPEKNFIWAGRELKLKNLENLKISFSEAQKEKQDIKLEIIKKIPRQELMQKIQNCYVVILPSISDISPNFILDAIRMNKPFIMTKESGLFEKLGKIGLFIDPLDKNDIKEKIAFLADDANYAECKRKIEDFNFIHSWQQIANEYLIIYKNL
jgi:glycosyltransferase involved in cell wall biosynthesis